MKQIEVSIANDFTKTPTGRYAKDGPFSGESFRRQILGPALLDNDVVTVILDGTYGFGSSFLEEAFGGLVRDGFSMVKLSTSLNIVSSDQRYIIDEIFNYIKVADDRR